MMNRDGFQKRVVCFAACLWMMVGGGCGLNMTKVDKQILTDYSPEWGTMLDSREQRVYRAVNSLDTDFRQFNDDLDSVLFLDRPMRLTRMPMP